MSLLAFIPARGGSRRIPRKNVKTLGGKPLLQWTIEAAQKSGEFARVVVSSEDPEIVELARKSGVEADLRPEPLGGDRIRFIEVLAEFLARPEQAELEAAAVLLPTTPFRSAQDIRDGVAAYRRSPECAVIAVNAYDFPPEFACDFEEGSSRLTLRSPETYAHSTQSQSVPRAWHPNGALYLASVARLKSTHSYFVGPLIGLPIPAERALDLDYPHQWPAAEALISPNS